MRRAGDCEARMTGMPAVPHAAQHGPRVPGAVEPGRWWPLGLVLLLVAGIYFGRLAQPDARGEEPRRARIAVEMVESGDWIVPRQQGVPFLSRPPLHNWLIALAGQVAGRVDLLAIRLPSVLAVLLTSLIIYGYARSFLSPLGAMTSALAFATSLQVLELGRLGETEALFTLLVGGSILLWRTGDVRAWPPLLTWSAAYLMVGLATLTKGPQAPVYFGLAVCGWLLMMRRGRELLWRAHLGGALLGLMVVAAWQVPFMLRMGWQATRQIYCADVGFRFSDTGAWTVARHVAEFPAEVFLGCLLPWSPLLAVFAFRDFRRRLGAARADTVFLAWAAGAAFLTCWVVPGAKGRYFMPLYPCIAPLIGLAAQRCWEAPPTAWWPRLGPALLAAASLLMPAAALFLLVATWLDRPDLPLQQPWPFALAYLAACVALAASTWWARPSSSDAQRAAGVAAVAAFAGLTVGGVLVNLQVRHGVDTRQQVADLRARLPDGVQLASFGPVDPLFAFHYGEAIRRLPAPAWEPGCEPQVTWFCHGGNYRPKLQMPFDHDVLGTVCCDRFRREEPFRTVVVGRRIGRPPGENAEIASRAAGETIVRR